MPSPGCNLLANSPLLLPTPHKRCVALHGPCKIRTNCARHVGCQLIQESMRSARSNRRSFQRFMARLFAVLSIFQ